MAYGRGFAPAQLKNCALDPLHDEWLKARHIASCTRRADLRREQGARPGISRGGGLDAPALSSTPNDRFLAARLGNRLTVMGRDPA